MNNEITAANLAALDAAIDAVESPRYILVNKWWLDFLNADKRKRGRLIRQRRKKLELEKHGVETSLSVWVELKNKLHAEKTCGKITSKLSDNNAD